MALESGQGSPLTASANDSPFGSRKGMSKGCKCCIGCALVSLVALGAGIPIGLFVIGPHVAQGVLNGVTVSLPNLTQAACPQNYTWLFNHAKINVPGIGPIKLSSTLESYTQEVWTTSCEIAGEIKPGAECGKNAKEHKLGYYTSPDMTVSAGDNNKDFTVVMTGNSTVILDAWVVPLIMKEKTRLILKAKDVTVKVMGIPFKSLTMRNDMTCTFTNSSTIDIPASVCQTKYAQNMSTVITAKCESGVHDIAVTTTQPPTTRTTTSTSKAKVAAIFA